MAGCKPGVRHPDFLRTGVHRPGSEALLPVVPLLHPGVHVYSLPMEQGSVFLVLEMRCDPGRSTGYHGMMCLTQASGGVCSGVHAYGSPGGYPM